MLARYSLIFIRLMGKLAKEERAFYNACTAPREYLDYMNTLGRFRASVSWPRRERVNVLNMYVRLDLENGFSSVSRADNDIIKPDKTTSSARNSGFQCKDFFLFFYFVYFLLAPVGLRSPKVTWQAFKSLL